MDSNVDVPYSIRSLTFGAGAGAFTLTGSTLTVANGITGHSTVVIGNSSSATQAIGNDIAFNGFGGIRAASGDLVLNGKITATSSPKEIQFNAFDDKTLTLNGVISGTITNVYFTSNSNDLGTGTIVLNATNSYTVTSTRLYSGTVVVNVDALKTGGAFGKAALINMAANKDGTFRPELLTGSSVTVAQDITVSANTHANGATRATIGGIHTAGTSIFSGNITIGGSNTNSQQPILSLTAETGGRVDITGNILRAAGTVTGKTDSIEKVGAGIVAISGSGNTYAGTTTVTEGTLLINGTLATVAGANAAVTVNANATLGGTGTIGRDVNITSGAFLEIGDNNESLTGNLNIIGNLNLAHTATVKFDLGAGSSTSDSLNVTGIVALGAAGNTITFDINTLAGFGTSATYTLLTSSEGFDGSTSNILLTGAGLENYRLQIGTNSISLISTAAIPEPGTVALLIGSALSAFFFVGRPRPVFFIPPPPPPPPRY